MLSLLDDADRLGFEPVTDNVLQRLMKLVGKQINHHRLLAIEIVRPVMFGGVGAISEYQCDVYVLSHDIESGVLDARAIVQD